MNSKLKSALQVLFSLTLGFFLIWIIYKDLSQDDKDNIFNSFKEANYWWIVASTFVAVLSHVFRAYRWKYPLESLGIHIDMPNRFAAVMIGYLANLAFPRLGEVSRCAVLARYKKTSFEQLFGTVIAERLIDFLVLLSLIFLAVILQFSILKDFLTESFGPMMEKAQSLIILGVVGVVGLGAAFILWKFIQGSTHPIAITIRERIGGLIDGLATLKTMKGQGQFYLHTFFIWASYIFMFVLTFQSFPETAEVPFGGMLASFVLGGLSIVAVQGGLGAYPLAIMVILVLYGVPEARGYAFGWIVWVAQTAMIILVGFLSIIAMPLINRNETTADESL